MNALEMPIGRTMKNIGGFLGPLDPLQKRAFVQIAGSLDPKLLTDSIYHARLVFNRFKDHKLADSVLNKRLIEVTFTLVSRLDFTKETYFTYSEMPTLFLLNELISLEVYPQRIYADLEFKIPSFFWILNAIPDPDPYVQRVRCEALRVTTKLCFRDGLVRNLLSDNISLIVSVLRQIGLGSDMTTQEARFECAVLLSGITYKWKRKELDVEPELILDHIRESGISTKERQQTTLLLIATLGNLSRGSSHIKRFVKRNLAWIFFYLDPPSQKDGASYRLALLSVLPVIERISLKSDSLNCSIITAIARDLSVIYSDLSTSTIPLAPMLRKFILSIFSLPYVCHKKAPPLTPQIIENMLIDMQQVEYRFTFTSGLEKHSLFNLLCSCFASVVSVRPLIAENAPFIFGLMDTIEGHGIRQVDIINALFILQLAIFDAYPGKIEAMYAHLDSFFDLLDQTTLASSKVYRSAKMVGLLILETLYESNKERVLLKKDKFVPILFKIIARMPSTDDKYLEKIRVKAVAQLAKVFDDDVTIGHEVQENILNIYKIIDKLPSENTEYRPLVFSVLKIVFKIDVFDPGSKFAHKPSADTLDKLERLAHLPPPVDATEGMQEDYSKGNRLLDTLIARLRAL